MSRSWITFLLPVGESEIAFDRCCIGKSIGLLPLGQPCLVSTTGLKWNLGNLLFLSLYIFLKLFLGVLDNQTLSFGGLISTSNTFENDFTDSVCVTTDHPLLFVVSTIGQD